jgi:site-specific DNA recombinase
MYEQIEQIKNKKAILYQRKSTEDEDRQVASIEDQYNANLQVIDRYSLVVDKRLILKESKSAKEPGRDEFNKMIEFIDKGLADLIVAWHPNRLARNGQDAGRLIQLLSDGKLKAILTPHKSFFNSGTDILLLYIDFGLSDKYSKDLSVDVRRGMVAKAKRGWYPGNPKTGYLNTTKHGITTQIIDPDRFPLLRLAVEKYLTGIYTVPQILDYLNKGLGFKTRKTKRIGGKPMVMSKLYKILRDPFYYGKIVWGGIESELQESCPRLMTEEEYWKIQTLLGKKGTPRPKKYFDLPYRGIFRCGTCNGQVIPYVKNVKLSTGELKTYKYLKCTRNRRHVDCRESQITFSDFEKQIQNILESIAISEEFYNWAVRWLKYEHKQKSKEQETIIKNLNRKVESNQKELNNLINMYAEELITKVQFVEQKKLKERERRDANNKLKELESNSNNWIKLAQNTIEFARYSQERFLNGDWETKMLIIRSLGSKFILKDRKVYIDLEKPFFIFKTNYEQIHFDIPRVEIIEEPVPAMVGALSIEENSSWWGGWESNPHHRFFRPAP